MDSEFCKRESYGPNMPPGHGGVDRYKHEYFGRIQMRDPITKEVLKDSNGRTIFE